MKQRLKQRLLAKLKPAGQEHLLAFWDQLDETGQQKLARQIEDLDLELLAELFRQQRDQPDWAELASRAEPPPAYRLRGQAAIPRAQARQQGEQALRAGQLGMILVAGGQATRLNFDHPKGLFPLGPVSQRTLFQILVDRLRAVAQRYEVRIPLYVMTSPQTHEETLQYFRQHHWLGLDRNEVVFFCQGTMPVLDAETGKLLLEAPDRLAQSPDGHGGVVPALASSDALQHARQWGIEYLFYGQVDNPLLQVCDPELIGYHLLAGAQITTQAVEKCDPFEKVGVVVSADDRLHLIEYSDLPDEAADQRNPDGSLRLWAGNIAVHVFGLPFLAEAAQQAGEALPFHRALKKMSYLDAQGRLVQPERSNALKFEKFVFDLLPWAERAIVVEADRAEAFAAVKNAPGAAADTPETARAAMVAQATRWLSQAGARVDHGVPVEISPLWALDAEQVARRVPAGLHVTEPTY